MSVAMTALFDTKYEGSGAKQAVLGVHEVDESLKKVEGSSDRLVTKLERPIGRIAYGGLAESALSAASANVKLDGVTGTLHQTFHVLGSSLLFINPELGFLALAATAVITVFAKLNNATELTAENISKQIEESKKLRNEYKESADILLKQGVITKQQAEVFKNASTAKESEIVKVKESITLKIKETQATINQITAEGHLIQGSRQLVQNKSQLATETKKLNDLTLVYNALLPDAKEKEDELVKAFEHSQKAMGEKYYAQARIMEQEKQRREYAGQDEKVIRHLFDTEAEIEVLTEALEKAKTEVVRREVQARINEKQREVAADKIMLTAQVSIQKQLVDSVIQSSHIIADTWLQSNHNMVKVAEMFGAELIKSVGNVYATRLEIQAASDFFDPLRGPGIAVAELAAAIGIRTISGGLASDLSGSQVSSNAVAPSSASGSSSSSLGGGGGNAPNNVGLTIVLNGIHTLDNNFMASFLNRQNDFVQNSNGQVISTHIVTQNGTVVAAG